MTSPGRIDFRVIIEVPLRQFAPWLVMVLIVTWSGYPGVVCVMPMAWLIALRVGIVCVTRSTSSESAKRLLESVLAGAWLGLLQGLLFLVIAPRMGPIRPSEQTSMIVITSGMIVAGMLAGSVLSFFTAYLTERRRKSAS